jgi:hypothetical protein
MMFDCPTLAAARLQYHVVFGAHVEMKAAFTRPVDCCSTCIICSVPCHLPHPEMNT